MQVDSGGSIMTAMSYTSQVRPKDLLNPVEGITVFKIFIESYFFYLVL